MDKDIGSHVHAHWIPYFWCFRNLLLGVYIFGTFDGCLKGVPFAPIWLEIGSLFSTTQLECKGMHVSNISP